MVTAHARARRMPHGPVSARAVAIVADSPPSAGRLKASVIPRRSHASAVIACPRPLRVMRAHVRRRAYDRGSGEPTC